MAPNPSRRNFLKAAGSLPLAASLASTGRAQAPPPGYRKAVKIGMVGEGKTLVEKFQLLKDLGFDGVELDSPNGFATEEVLAAKEATGLPIHGVVDSVHWAKPFSHPDPQVRKEGVQALETAIRDAKAYGASSVLVVPAVVNKGIRYDQAWKRSLHEIGQVLPLAEELQIQLAFENVWNHFLLSPMEAAQYVDAFSSSQVGFYFDVGNIVNYGWPEHWIHILGKRILKVDVKEYSRKRRDQEGLWKGFGVELLEGDCDWPAVMRAFEAIEYRGWFTAEIRGGDRQRLTDIATRMDRIFAS